MTLSTQNFLPKTFVVAGIELDIYGLHELKGKEVAVIFILHGRRNDRTSMVAYCQTLLRSVAAKAEAAGGQAKELVVVNLDQRNHGSRCVHRPSNNSFSPAGSSSDSGNDSHALDMYTLQTGTARDVSLLIDVLPAYLFPLTLTDWFVSGFSMGGHSAWILLRQEPRIRLGVPWVGCPDYLSLLSARAQSLPSPIPLSSSTHFPPPLLSLIASHDPISTDYTSKNPSRNPYLGKKILVISGTRDEAVPVRFTEPFFEALEVGEEGKKELWMFEGGHEQKTEAMDKAANFLWEEGLQA